MKLRPRTSDALLAIGLVALVAWTPAYFAQSAEERALLDGERFWLRDVRDGDRMDLELIVTWPNGTSYTTGPIVNVTYEAAGEDAPAGAWFSETMDFQRTHTRLGGATLALDTRTRTTWYNHDYQRVETDAAGIGPHVASPPDAPIPVWPGIHRDEKPGVTRSGDWGSWEFLWGDRDEALWYNRTPTIGSLFDFLQSEPNGPTHDNETPSTPAATRTSKEEWHRVQAIYRHRDVTLYGINVQTHGWGGFASPPVDSILAGMWSLEMTVGLDEAIERDGGTRKWDWYARGFPVKVGFHHEVFDEAGNVRLALDLVPHRLVEGETNLPAPPASVPRGADGSTSIREWGQDQDPVIGSVSPATLASLLSTPQSPPGIRSFMSATGWVAGMAWATNTTVDMEPIDDIDWWLQVLNDRGESRVVTMTTTTDGSLVEPIRSLCDADVLEVAGKRARVECVTVDLRGDRHGVFGSPVANRTTSAPSVLVGTLSAELREYLSDEVDAVHVRGFLMPPFGAWVPSEHGGRSMHPVVTASQMEPVLIAEGAGQHWVVSSDIDNASLKRYQHVDWTISERSLAAMQPQTAGGVTQPLHPVSFVDGTAGFAGLSLVALGLLLRLGAALKSGAHLPLAAALYAKVTRDRSLDSERRQHLAALVAADPGVALAEVAREAGLHRTVAYHHLDTLRRNGLLQEIRLGRTRHYVPEGIGRSAATYAAALHHQAWREVLEAIQAEPGLDLTTLAHRVDRHKSRASRVVRRLSDYGLVRREAAGTTLALYPTWLEGHTSSI